MFVYYFGRRVIHITTARTVYIYLLLYRRIYTYTLKKKKTEKSVAATAVQRAPNELP